MAVEYLHSKKLFVKSDVFAFGCVILEVVTGADGSLSSWVSQSFMDRTAFDTVDTRLNLLEEEVGEVFGTLKLGLTCTTMKAEERPTMNEVIRLLEGIGMFRKKLVSLED